MIPNRVINSRLSPRQIPELLQSVFVAELLVPSRCIWLVSPWVSDIPIIDNTANNFLTLEPSWSRSRIRLSQVLLTLAEKGTTIHVATRPDTHNRSFMEGFKMMADAKGLAVKLHQKEELHAKGLVGDSFALNGSMNFTFNGISVNEEELNYYTDPTAISERKIILTERWGGVKS